MAQARQNQNHSNVPATRERAITPELAARQQVAEQMRVCGATVAKILHNDPDAIARFTRIAMRYYTHNTNPQMVSERAAAAMLKVDPRSFVLACVDALADGLMPDGKQGAIIPRGAAAVWTPMWRGLVALARRGSATERGAGIHNLRAQVVYKIEMDKGAFRLDYGRNLLEHVPWQMLGVQYVPKDEDIVCAYARCTLREADGYESQEFRVLWRDNLEKRRAMSGNPHDKSKWTQAWDQWFAEMCCAKAMRALCDWLPMPTAYLDAVDRADERERTTVTQVDGDDTPLTDGAVVPISAGAEPRGLVDDIRSAGAALPSSETDGGA